MVKPAITALAAARPKGVRRTEEEVALKPLGLASRPAAKQIDPALRRAISGDSVQGPLTVMLKLDTKKSAFGKHPVTNRSGSARERTFNREVDDLVQDVAPGGHYKILSTAANLGVATVEASAGAVKGLLRSSKITGMKLKLG